jgi:hypothetical protein
MDNGLHFETLACYGSPPNQNEQGRRCCVHGPLKLVSYVIVLLMALAVLYAAYISVTYWTGIGV